MNFSAVSASVAASITQAVSFLTTPLITTHSSEVVGTLRAILQANLLAPLSPSGDISLHFKLSPFVLPPAAILGACIASGITWAAWSKALGAKLFELIVTNTSVRILLSSHARPITFWQGQQNRDALLETTSFVPPISRIQRRETGIVARRPLVSPTTTQTRAPVIRIPQLPGQFKKPSSRLANSFSPFDDSDDESDADSDYSISSHLSTFSFDSSSDEGSMTSASSYCSDDEIPFIPVSPLDEKSTPVVNLNHKVETSFLYQCGSTRVMTGGVMFGKAATASLKTKLAPIARPVAKLAAPIVRVARPIRQPKGRSGAATWHRVF
ncbi:hypothetical protein DL96DRAFT_391567 [Flagelloscypha sp. PMI_526]|nr:hypothetical protein DL96DRAFT_391567 [Flagelloscypha sp. PMI_526]